MKLLGLIFTLTIYFPIAYCLSNPYQILEITRTATTLEIKQAYKKLVKEWHPDKNKSPEAETKFIEINKAYELLLDPYRRDEFDRFGVTEQSLNFPRQPQGYKNFEGFFQGGKFQFQFSADALYGKQRITSKAYENNIIPKSARKPYLILVYSDWCFGCLQAEPVWERITLDMEPLGIGIGTVNAQQEGNLVHKLGIRNLPAVFGVIDERVIHYKNALSVMKLIEFTKSMFPFNTITKINNENYEQFLNDWHDNRVRVLFFSKLSTPRLRYLVVSYIYHFYAAFGYVLLGQPDTEAVRQRYGVNSDVETLLIFKENINSPVATLSMQEMPPSALHEIIESNKFLLLPRLSSQAFFDELCPPEPVKLRKRLCVVLITNNIPDHDSYRNSLRRYVMKHPYNIERIHFTYVYRDKQKQFTTSLVGGEQVTNDSALSIAIIWRTDKNTMKYDWLQDGWPSEEMKEDRLKPVLQRLLRSEEILSYNAILPELIDEHAQGFIGKVITKMVLLRDYIMENFTRDEALPLISVLVTVAVIVIAGYVMAYLVKLEEESIKAKNLPNPAKPPPKKPVDRPVIVHELRAETYNGLVRMLKPGCRSIVILVDAESKGKLVKRFSEIIYPYRRNNSLSFAFLMLEKHLEWYKRLLIQTLTEPRELNINPKNCVGTVLSLNGLRKYFCMYHAKHPGPAAVSKKNKSKKKKKKSSTESGAEFIGFNDDSSSTESDELEEVAINEADPILYVENLLDQLPNWLDRLFEGSLQRYYVQFWPIMK